MPKKEQPKWVMPEWMEKYRDLIGNTGGNSVEQLMNNHSANLFNNSPLVVLICSVDSQVNLLARLHKEGMIL